MPLPVRVSSRAPRSSSLALRKAENSFCASSTARVNCSKLKPMRCTISAMTSVFLWPSGCSPGSLCSVMIVGCKAPAALVRARQTFQRAR